MSLGERVEGWLRGLRIRAEASRARQRGRLDARAMDAEGITVFGPPPYPKLSYPLDSPECLAAYWEGRTGGKGNEPDS